MISVFDNKSTKILVVEGSGSARTQLTEVIRGFGFSDISGVPNLKDALGVLELEPVDWIVTSLFADSPENALHLLKICASTPELKNLTVSLLLEPGESYVLPTAFMYGLLSWHTKPFTKDSLNQELGSLLELIKQEQWNSTTIAAHFLRRFLLEKENYQELLGLEKGLIEIFPTMTNLLINLIAPLAKLDRKREARAALKQLRLIDPSLNEKINEQAASYLDGVIDDGEAEEKGFNFLGLRRVLVVDADDAIQKLISDTLKEIGIEGVTCTSDGEEALAHLEKEPNPDLIIQEWRIPKVPGPLFLQKAKAAGAASTPFIVVSSLIQDGDMPFVREMGVAAIINKPVERSMFLRTLIWTVQQDRMPTEQSTMERKIRELLQRNKFLEAGELKAKFLSDTQIPDGAKSTIEAEVAFAIKEYDRARDFCIEAIKRSGDSIFILNLLGKALMNLRDFEIALRCFQKAQTLSPLNIERICSIAEVHSEMGNKAEASKSLDEARDIDADNTRIKEAEVKIAINSGEIAKAKGLMNELEAIENVVSFMNNSAVAMANCKMVNEGIEHYHKTLQAIPDKRSDIKAIVLYNLGLAYARNGDLEQALVHLKLAIAIEGTKIHKRAVSLAKRIEKALDSGASLNLKLPSHRAQAPVSQEKNEAKTPEDTLGQSAESEELNNVNREVLAAVEAQKGELGCYLLYRPLKIDDKAANLLKDPPRFKLRKAILRGESRGADKLMASRAS